MKWTGDTTFEIEGTKFRIDASDGGKGAKTNEHEYVIAKHPSFLDRYIGLKYSGYQKILELGAFEGGSFVFLDKLLKPKKISVVDLMEIPRPVFEAYVAANAPRTSFHCPVSQDDPEALERIVQDDFGGEVDLIIDDASHYYDQTRTSFLTLYPKVRPGGLYIIEDWGWSFHEPFQGPNGFWKERKSLVNLVIELLEEISLNSSIVDMTVTADMVMLKKPLTPAHSPLLTRHGRRDRQWPDL